jgi:hypothetical protein
MSRRKPRFTEFKRREQREIKERLTRDAFWASWGAAVLRPYMIVPELNSFV